MCVLESVEEIDTAAVLGQQREFKGTEVLPLVNHCDGAHQRAEDQLDMIFEVVDLIKEINVIT